MACPPTHQYVSNIKFPPQILARSLTNSYPCENMFQKIIQRSIDITTQPDSYNEILQTHALDGRTGWRSVGFTKVPVMASCLRKSDNWMNWRGNRIASGRKWGGFYFWWRLENPGLAGGICGCISATNMGWVMMTWGFLTGYKNGSSELHLPKLVMTFTAIAMERSTIFN